MRIDNYSDRPNLLNFILGKKTWALITVKRESVYWWNTIDDKFIFVCEPHEQPKIFKDGFFMTKKEAEKKLSELLKQ